MPRWRPSLVAALVVGACAVPATPSALALRLHPAHAPAARAAARWPDLAPDVRAGWRGELRGAARQALATALLLALPFFGSPGAALAENELAAQCGGRFDTSLIDRECFVHQCQSQTQACLENSDCMKGLVCTARCLGETKCISGCFARFGNKDIDGLIKCSIEDNACIKVAILEPGPDAPERAPRPPLPVVPDFEPRSLEGRWFKVMGWNSMYDCYDCQTNRFSQAQPPRAPPQPQPAAVRIQDVPPSVQQLDGPRPPPVLQVDVDFDMPRPSTLLRSGHNHQHLRERLEFDVPGSARTAHTHGTMFGLSLWEN